MKIIIELTGTRNSFYIYIKNEGGRDEELEYNGESIILPNYEGKYFFNTRGGRLYLGKEVVRQEIRKKIEAGEEPSSVIKNTIKKIKEEKQKIISSCDFTPIVGIFEFEI